jgi:predicted aconitase
MASRTLTVSAIGVPWYTRQNYARILQVMEDAHLLPKTYDRWLSAAEQVLQRAKSSGAVPVKAYIDPETFPSWCQERGLKADANARMQFANSTARAHYQQSRA